MNRLTAYMTMPFLVALAPPAFLFAEDGQPSASPGRAETAADLSGDSEIASLVGLLGSPLYEERLAATRKLIALGPRARPQLEAAAAGDDFETALRAKDLLVTLDRLLFAGVDVSLAFSKSSASWEQPVDLLITMTNRSAYPARVPFEQSVIDPPAVPGASPDAEQVGRMLDIADWLKVRREPDGREIDLRVDDIAVDEEVVAAVQRRLNAKLGGILKAGQQVTVTIPAFNRGWSRYPMLDEGSYRVVLDYQPAWDDEVLLAGRAGRVVTSPASLAITRSAPATVSRGGVVSSLSLVRRGEELVASLTNSSDQTLLVNKNFGIGPPFADGRWVYHHRLDESSHEVRMLGRAAASWGDIDPGLLPAISPGDSVVLASIAIGDLQKKLHEAGADLGGPAWTIRFRYGNLTDRAWQVRQGAAMLGNPNAPALFRNPLPRNLLTTHQTSNELPGSTLAP